MRVVNFRMSPISLATSARRGEDDQAHTRVLAASGAGGYLRLWRAARRQLGPRVPPQGSPRRLPGRRAAGARQPRTIQRSSRRSSRDHRSSSGNSGRPRRRRAGPARWWRIRFCSSCWLAGISRLGLNGPADIRLPARGLAQRRPRGRDADGRSEHAAADAASAPGRNRACTHLAEPRRARVQTPSNRQFTLATPRSQARAEAGRTPTRAPAMATGSAWLGSAKVAK